MWLTGRYQARSNCFFLLLFFFFFFFLKRFSISSGILRSLGFIWVRLQQPQEQRYLFVPMCAEYLYNLQTVVRLPVSGIFNISVNIDECDGLLPTL